MPATCAHSTLSEFPRGFASSSPSVHVPLPSLHYITISFRIPLFSLSFAPFSFPPVFPYYSSLLSSFPASLPYSALLSNFQLASDPPCYLFPLPTFHFPLPVSTDFSFLFCLSSRPFLPAFIRCLSYHLHLLCLHHSFAFSLPAHIPVSAPIIQPSSLIYCPVFQPYHGWQAGDCLHPSLFMFRLSFFSIYRFDTVVFSSLILPLSLLPTRPLSSKMV